MLASLRGLTVVWLVVGAACTPVTEPSSEPKVTPQPASDDPQPKIVELPPLDQVLFESRTAVIGPPLVAMDGATFPELTLYTDGTLLRAVLVEPEGFGRELRIGRLAPEQLERVHTLMAALGPLDQVERTEPLCHLEPFAGSVHVRTHFRLRSDDDWLCLRGCPASPAELAAAFVELVDYLDGVELDETLWQPTHGHFAVYLIRDPRGTLPWTSDSWDRDFPHAWALDVDSFPELWARAGGQVGGLHVERDGAEFLLIVVPWRPGEDLSATLESFNRGSYEPPGCPREQTLPRPNYGGS